jgi:hypothetical protein
MPLIYHFIFHILYLGFLNLCSLYFLLFNPIRVNPSNPRSSAAYSVTDAAGREPFVISRLSTSLATIRP